MYTWWKMNLTWLTFVIDWFLKILQHAVAKFQNGLGTNMTCWVWLCHKRKPESNSNVHCLLLFIYFRDLFSVALFPPIENRDGLKSILYLSHVVWSLSQTASCKYIAAHCDFIYCMALQNRLLTIVYESCWCCYTHRNLIWNVRLVWFVNVSIL